METQRHSPRLLGITLAATTAIFFLLELWRPCFFLTDDNLDGGLPFFTEVGRHLLAGQSPFVSDYLFDGHYNYLRDAVFFLWHPLYLLVSLLAGTPFRYEIIDVDAFVFFLFAAAGFVQLAQHVRRELDLAVSDGWILFYTLSFTYNLMAITTGASWMNFLCVHGTLPWLALGILQRDWKRGAGLVLGATLSMVLGGHPTVVVSTLLLFSLFAALVAWGWRSWQPLAGWLLGVAGAMVLALPVLVPVVEGFAMTFRSQGVSLHDMQDNNIPLEYFPVSLCLGGAIWMIQKSDVMNYTSYTCSLGACAAAWGLIPAMLSRKPWRAVDGAALGMMLVTMVLIWRPTWISQVMLHLPFLRSMRWPFREMLDFQLFFHLWLLLRVPTGSIRFQRALAVAGALIMIVPTALCPLVPTFNPMEWDRRALFSGGFDVYWSRVRPLLGPDARVAVIFPGPLYDANRFVDPYSLLGTYNYATMARVISVWGWSQTPPKDQIRVRTIPHYVYGAYLEEQRARLWANDPDVKIITLESRDPLKITLSTRDGPVIDLTPLVPPDLRHP